MRLSNNKTAGNSNACAVIRGCRQRVYTYVTGSEEDLYSINIDASDRSKDVSDDMWGLFFEDINSAADGGLYAEMVKTVLLKRVMKRRTFI